MRRIFANIVVTVLLVVTYGTPALASGTPPAWRYMRGEIHRLASKFPAASAIEVMDLSSGYRASYNAGASMPAASTIKVPVMVEVFRQLEAGNFDLRRRVELLARDKDYGSGDLCNAPVGARYDVADLLSKMIDISDNTATNMLIRLVGRTHINRTMNGLGLERTHLTQDVRTSNWSVRRALRSSPDDMVRLLAMMARRNLIDAWSSDEMI
ncbi:MAG: serine hydrolase, partial [Candidatus Baltobacteraceae bacterium]